MKFEKINQGLPTLIWVVSSTTFYSSRSHEVVFFRKKSIYESPE